MNGYLTLNKLEKGLVQFNTVGNYVIKQKNKIKTIINPFTRVRQPNITNKKILNLN